MIEDLERYCALVFPDSLITLNGLEGDSPVAGTSFGVFTDLAKLLAAAGRADGHTNLYLNCNEVHPDILGRCNNKLKPYQKRRYNGDDVIRRLRLVFDCDPVRRSGINSTDDEHEIAILKARAIRHYLTQHGWPDPILGDSGNGANLTYRIDLPVESPLVKQVLEHVAAKFNNEAVTVDTSLDDPGQIIRALGTLNRKGDDTEDRPRRRSRIIEAPEAMEIVTEEKLVALAPAPAPATAPTPATAAPTISITGQPTFDEMLELVRSKGFTASTVAKSPERYVGGRVIQLDTSHLDHQGNTAILYISTHTARWQYRNAGSSKKTYRFRQFCEDHLPELAEPPMGLLDEMRLAREVLAKYHHPDAPRLRYYNESWYVWDGSWRLLTDDGLDILIYTTCKAYLIAQSKKIKNKKGDPACVPQFGGAQASNVRRALRSMVVVGRTGWVDGRAGIFKAFADSILDLGTWIEREEVVRVPATPAYFDPHPLPYRMEYTEAEPTIMLAALRDQMTESEVDCYQEFGGYCFTDENRIQKGLLMNGPPRSFKGTAERIIKNRIGEHNCVSKRLDKLNGDHALENLPGKLLLAISDHRTMKKSDVMQGLEIILAVIGQDALDINPKGKAVFTGKPVAKVFIACNQLPEFDDSTDALLSRLLFLRTTKSYVGKEDPTLLDRCLTQGNEITWWFLRGLRRLLQNGKYTLPDNNLAREFREKNAPLLAFVEQCCELGGESDKDALYERFAGWCEERGVVPETNDWFYRGLYGMSLGIKSREHGRGESRRYTVAGISLREAA